MQECFDSLDEQKTGSIGVEQLEDPLVGLGFADTRDDVQEMVDLVDEDGSGKIEFGEFLSIIKNADANEKTAKINKFFKDLTNGNLNSGSEDISFYLLVQRMRRNYLMDGLMSDNREKKEFGQKILKNVSKQLRASKFPNKGSSVSQ